MNNIVLACETENAETLVEGVFSALYERAAKRVDGIKTTIGAKLLKEDCEPNKMKTEEVDSYDKEDKKVQEAVDYVVEVVLEERSDLDQSIKEASEKYDVSAEKLKEYFTAFFENVRGDSIKSNDDAVNQDKMNDEDADRRIRFEQTLRLDDGTSVRLTEETRNSIEIVYNQLTDENKNKFVSKLTESRQGFDKMSKFCLRMVND
jgi:hypothetical protein